MRPTVFLPPPITLYLPLFLLPSDASVMSDAPASDFPIYADAGSLASEGRVVGVGIAKIGLKSKAKVFITSDDDIPAIGFEKTQIR